MHPSAHIKMHSEKMKFLSPGVFPPALTIPGFFFSFVIFIVESSFYTTNGTATLWQQRNYLSDNAHWLRKKKASAELGILSISSTSTQSHPFFCPEPITLCLNL